MSFQTNQKGFSVIEIVIVVAVIALLGFVGYVFYNNLQGENAVDTSQNSSQQASADDVEEAPEINKTSDLDEASATLDSIDTESDSSEIDNELNNF